MVITLQIFSFRKSILKHWGYANAMIPELENNNQALKSVLAYLRGAGVTSPQGSLPPVELIWSHPLTSITFRR